MKKGNLIGVGVGPGDPDLLTVRAVKALETADVIAYFSKEGNKSNARCIVDSYVSGEKTELPLSYPITIEEDSKSEEYQSVICQFFDKAADDVAHYLEDGKTVAVLSAGDPFLFGSYMHLHIRLSKKYKTEVIPGIMAMSGCWTLADTPIAQGDDVLSILPGTLSEDVLLARLQNCEAAVIMKVGRNLPKVKRAIDKAGKLHKAVYVERGTMQNGKSVPLSQCSGSHAPYFSLILIPGWEKP